MEVFHQPELTASSLVISDCIEYVSFPFAIQVLLSIPSISAFSGSWRGGVVLDSHVKSCDFEPLTCCKIQLNGHHRRQSLNTTGGPTSERKKMAASGWDILVAVTRAEN